MIFLYALLAHLIADYLLQPANLVAWKNISAKGVFVHASIHFLLTTILLYLITGQYQVVFVALAISLAHFCIDSVKARFEKQKRNHYLDYWLDQLCHYFSILLGTSLAAPYLQIHQQISSSGQFYWNYLFLNPALAGFLIISIFSTLTLEYSHLYLQPKRVKKSFKLNRRAMLQRLFISSLIYIGLLFSFIPGAGFSL
jgi:hypothetical protein